MQSGLLRECVTAEDFSDPVGLAHAIKSLPLKVVAPRPLDEAISSAGGVTFEVLDHFKRPVSAVADGTEVRNVLEVHVEEDSETELVLLFDPEHGLEERILNEQFTP